MNIDALVEKAKEGDRKALEEIIETYRPFVIKTASGIFVAGSDIEDLIQEGCISIINSVKLYSKSKCPSFTSYVTNAVRKNYFYAIRKTARRNHDCSLESEISERPDLKECFCDDFDLEEDYIQKEAIEDLEEAMEILSEEEAEFLREIYDDKAVTMKKKAEELGIKYAALMKKRNKIIKKLRMKVAFRAEPEKLKK